MVVSLRVQFIKKQLASMCLTGCEFSKICGISRQSLSTILRRGTCTLRNAGRIAQALGVEVGSILFEERLSDRETCV